MIKYQNTESKCFTFLQKLPLKFKTITQYRFFGKIDVVVKKSRNQNFLLPWFYFLRIIKSSDLHFNYGGSFSPEKI